MKNWIEHFRAAACGMPVSRVWRGYGSALFVEFGKLTPSALVRRDGSHHGPSGEIGLMIQWSWRIEDEHSVICGSWSDEDLWGPNFDRLVTQKVVDLTTFGRLPEVLVSLSGGFHIASFMTAEGEPEWTLFDRRGSTHIAVGCRSGLVQEEKLKPVEVAEPPASPLQKS